MILLSATPQTIYENVKDGKDRPLLNGNMNPDYIGKMMQERQPYYEKAKDIEIVTDEKSTKGCRIRDHRAAADTNGRKRGRGMIQDIGVEQLKNEYHPKPPKDESRIMIFDAGKLLCRINEEMQIAYPKYGEWRKNKADEGTLIYLFFHWRGDLLSVVFAEKDRDRGVCL